MGDVGACVILLGLPGHLWTYSLTVNQFTHSPMLIPLFPQETQELQKKQQWYQENQATLTSEDEDLYLSYCSQAMFRIRILEQRLNR